MNELGVAALVAAAMRGVPQLKNEFRDGQGRCAYAVLMDAARDNGSAPFIDVVQDLFSLSLSYPCPECNRGGSERETIFCLNDRHGWDFLKIARTLGPSTAP